MEIDLDRLPSRMKAFEDEAVRDFSLAFGPQFRRLFLHLGSRPADAESLAVTCITDVWLKLDRFLDRGPGSFRAWALRVARNTWFDERRRNPGWFEILGDPPNNEEAEFDTMPDPMISTAVVAALQRLSETDREVVRLRHLDGNLSFAEIGRSLKLSEGAARLRHHRAILALKDSLSAFAPREESIEVLMPLTDELGQRSNT